MLHSQMTAVSLLDLKLSQDEIHVWCVPLKQPGQVVEQFYELLSQDEKDRAGRYYFEHLRQSFVVARGLLRFFLACYMGLRAEQLEFTYLEAGKPQLSSKYDRKIFFNLSHSHELALYAFSRTWNVGIDIEYLRSVEDQDLIAERNFSAHEIAELKTLSPDKTMQGFFNCWTRKEAYIKALGHGISFPLQDFDVSLKPGEPAKLLSIRGNAQEATRWSMVDLYPAAGYAAALVVEGSVRNVVYREWNRLNHSINP